MVGSLRNSSKYQLLMLTPTLTRARSGIKCSTFIIFGWELLSPHFLDMIEFKGVSESLWVINYFPLSKSLSHR